jgi:erythromycin esterase-like protein
VPALDPVWTYLSVVDQDYARDVKSRITPIAARLDARGYEIVQRYGSLSPATRDTLRGTLDELAAHFVARKRNYVARSSLGQFIWAQRLVEIARQTEEAVRLGWNDPSNPRDRAMAENIKWIAGREDGRGLVVVWAHNLHVSRDSIGGPIFAERGPPVASMGHYLQADFGHRYIAIGTAFRAGGADTTLMPDPSSVDVALSQVGTARFGVEIRKAPTKGPIAAWLNGSHLMRAEDGYVTVRPHSAFDAIFFLDRVVPSVHVVRNSL